MLILRHEAVKAGLMETSRASKRAALDLLRQPV
jgi:hypothetical protein